MVRLQVRPIRLRMPCEAEAMSPDPDFSHVVGDARKRLMDETLPNHDEVHAHLDVDPALWAGDDS